MDSATGLTVVAAAALLFAAIHDVAFRTLPNWLSLGLAADGVALRLIDGHLSAGISCGLLVFTLAAICWHRSYLGGGDVKLLGATAILIPPGLVPEYVAEVALAGGVLAVLYLLLERLVPVLGARRQASFLWRIVIVECRRIRRRASLPYATAICAAALLTLIEG